MLKANILETIKKYINLGDVNNTVYLINELKEVEKESCLHYIKRNQIFNIRNPEQFAIKLKFIENFNREIRNNNFSYSYKLYFEFIEKMYISMNKFYLNFLNFYKRLEEEKLTDIFLIYLFSYYDLLHKDINNSMRETINKSLKKGIIDSTISIGIENKGNHVNDIDGQIQFIARFIKTNINFYKFMSKDKNIQLMPISIEVEKIQYLLDKLLEEENYSILESFNSWENGINQMTLVNLFDWELIKSQGKQIIYEIKAKNKKMNEYVNQEFGSFIYEKFRHVRNYSNAMKHIFPQVKNKKIKDIVLLEYQYIKDTFETEYFICSSIFSKVYLNYPIELYIKFFLIYRVYYFYFEKNTFVNIYILTWERILELFLENIDLFKDDKLIKNQGDLYRFIKTSIEFYTNNGNDIFNYPFFRYDLNTYAITNSIISTNLPRMFLEKLKDIKLDKYMSSKGKLLEERLLQNSFEMYFSGIRILKNIELFEDNKKVTDIDILIYDGKDILIAELKNQYIHNSYDELYKRKKELSRKAVKQINLAKSYLLKNEKKMSSELNIDLSKVSNIIPIVITTIDELNNNIINDTLIVSSFLFSTYFNFDHFVVKDHNHIEEHIVKEMYFRNTKISLENFIYFIRKNKSIKILEFFSDKKINSQTIFEHNDIVFKRIILSIKK